MKKTMFMRDFAPKISSKVLKKEKRAVKTKKMLDAFASVYAALFMSIAI
jgi:hypothetical protein